MLQTSASNCLQNLRESQLTLEHEFLGADTELSPAAIDFLNAAVARVNEDESAGFNGTDLDEHEQAMVV